MLAKINHATVDIFKIGFQYLSRQRIVIVIEYLLCMQKSQVQSLMVFLGMAEKYAQNALQVHLENTEQNGPLVRPSSRSVEGQLSVLTQKKSCHGVW